MQTMTQPAAGWYPDPSSPALLRFWSGTAWTAHAKPRPGLQQSVVESARRSQFRRFRRIA